MSEFVDGLMDLLQPLGEVSARRMFGGYGIYKDGLMFGLVAVDRFYLRTDELTKHHFIDKGCDAFVFGAREDHAPIVSKYYEPPELAFLNAQKMRPWALLAWEASLRAPAKKPRSRKSAAKKNKGS